LSHAEIPIFLVAGDLLPNIQGTLEDFDGYPLDLSAASSVAFMCRPSGTASTLFAGSCAFSTATEGASVGHITFTWAANFMPTAPDYYQAQFRVTDIVGRPRSVPNPGYHPLIVGTRM
jgi:hypothetical protein